MLISIITPIYQEHGNIIPLYESLRKTLSLIDKESEIIFINDGSTDGSAELLNGLAEKDKAVKVVHLRRNFGQTAALMAGIEASQGDIIIPIDGDMQNDPTDIPRLLAKLEEGYDVVSGWRKSREDHWSRTLPSRIANKLISLIFNVHLHDYGCSLKAYRRDVVANVRLYGEMHRYIPIYAAWEGARVTEIPVSHHPRMRGKSKYGFGRISRVILDVLLLYFMDRALDRPIQFFGKLAGYCWLAALAVGIWALWMKFAHIRDLIESPLPLLIVGLGLAGGMLLMLGLLAEMQMRIYYATQNRNHYSVRYTKNIDKP